MHTHLLHTISGQIIKLTPKDHTKIQSANQGEIIYLENAQVEIAMSNISIIYPIENNKKLKPDLIEDRKRQQVGMLHDGRPVRKHFGQWVLTDISGVCDEITGNIKPIVPDPDYYPETKKDCVPTPQEYEIKYAHLSLEERKQKMLGGGMKRLTESKPTQINNILKESIYGK